MFEAQSKKKNKVGKPAAPQARPAEPALKQAPEHIFFKLFTQSGAGSQAATGTAPNEVNETRTAPFGIIVEDGSPLGPGQLARSDFMARVRETVISTANAELAEVGRTSADCPYLNSWLAHYQTQSAERIERTVRAYARPEGANAAAMLIAIQERVRLAVQTWRTTGRIDQIPSIDVEAPGSDLQTQGESSDAAIQGKPLNPASGVTAVSAQTIRSGLGTGQALESGVRGRMESAFSQPFTTVRVHADSHAAHLSRQLSARAFTIGSDIAFSPDEYKPGTLRGDLLLAHELAHVVQQRNASAEASLPRSLGPIDHSSEKAADRAAIGAVASFWSEDLDLRGQLPGVPQLGRSELSLRGCRSCETDRTPQTRVPFSTVRTQWLAASDEPSRQAVLQAGVDSARAWRRELFDLTLSARGPIPAIRRRIQNETGVKVDENPYYGVNEDRVEQAYRSFGEGAVKEPWVLLALWVKEGKRRPLANSIPASTAAIATTLWRSIYYYYNMGLDHYTHTTATAGDNTIDETEAGAPAHETDFQARIAEQVAAGRLTRNIAADINAEISAVPDAANPGSFTVTATPRFYSLSMLLADAYFRENESALAANPAVGANPDPGLTYARWNMGASRFGNLLPSAEAHRMEPGHNLPGGSHPSIAQWAFHTRVRADEFGVPRTNAIRFLYYLEVYRLLYEGYTP